MRPRVDCATACGMRSGAPRALRTGGFDTLGRDTFERVAAFGAARRGAAFAFDAALLAWPRADAFLLAVRPDRLWPENALVLVGPLRDGTPDLAAPRAGALAIFCPPPEGPALSLDSIDARVGRGRGRTGRARPAVRHPVPAVRAVAVGDLSAGVVPLPVARPPAAVAGAIAQSGPVARSVAESRPIAESGAVAVEARPVADVHIVADVARPVADVHVVADVDVAIEIDIWPVARARVEVVVVPVDPRRTVPVVVPVVVEHAVDGVARGERHRTRRKHRAGVVARARRLHVDRGSGRRLAVDRRRVVGRHVDHIGLGGRDGDRVVLDRHHLGLVVRKVADRLGPGALTLHGGEHVVALDDHRVAERFGGVEVVTELDDDVGKACGECGDAFVPALGRRGGGTLVGRERRIVDDPALRLHDVERERDGDEHLSEHGVGKERNRGDERIELVVGELRFAALGRGDLLGLGLGCRLLDVALAHIAAHTVDRNGAPALAVARSDVDLGAVRQHAERFLGSRRTGPEIDVGRGDAGRGQTLRDPENRNQNKRERGLHPELPARRIIAAHGDAKLPLGELLTNKNHIIL